MATELTYQRLGRQRESFRRLRVICGRWRHALALPPTLPPLSRRKGPETILCLLLVTLLLLLFILVLLVKREVECRRERAIGPVVIENGVPRVLRNDTKNNRRSAG